MVEVYILTGDRYKNQVKVIFSAEIISRALKQLDIYYKYGTDDVEN